MNFLNRLTTRSLRCGAAMKRCCEGDGACGLQYPAAIVKNAISNRSVRRLFRLIAALGAAWPALAVESGWLERDVTAAMARGEKRLVVPPGVYRLTAASQQPHVRFRGLQNFEIDATGVTLLFTTPDHAPIVFEDCRDVILRGATLLQATLPYSQGRIEAIGADRANLRVRVAEGYPTRFTVPGGLPKLPPFYVFDSATRQWKRDTHDLNPARLEAVGDRVFQIVLPRPLPADEPIRAGDLMAWRGAGGADIRLAGCEKMEIIDVTIKGGRGFCVHESNGEGGNHYRFTVTYPEKPPGATEAPLLAANADAFHSSGMRRGPVVEGCRFEGMPDDGVAIHGAYGLVMECAGNVLTVDTRATSWRPGDAVRFIDRRGVVAGEARVRNVAASSGYVAPQHSQELRVFTDERKARYARLTLEGDAPAAFGWLISNPGAVGSGFIVRHNVVRQHRARGMLIKASDGTIEDNLVEGSTMGGIVVSPEMGYWNEADYARNLVIRRNTIRGVGTARQPWNPMAGALTIAAHEYRGYVPQPGGHENLRVEDNTFEANDGVNLLVTSARHVVIAGNRFVRPMQTPSTRGRDARLDPTTLIQLRECDDVTLRHNTVLAPGSQLRGLIGSVATTRLEGAKDGVEHSAAGAPR